MFLPIGSAMENCARFQNPQTSDGSELSRGELFIRALERVFGPSGFGSATVEVASLEDFDAVDHGATLRLHRERCKVQDFGVFASEKTIAAIAQNLFGLPADGKFDRNLLNDVLAEALNQFMGRVKEMYLAELDVRSRLDTPSRRSGIAGKVFVRSNQRGVLLRVKSQAWPDEVLFVASELSCPVLLGLEEAVSGMELAQQEPMALAWTQRMLDELSEKISLQNGLAANHRTIRWCASAVGRLMNGAKGEHGSALRDRIDRELSNLRESLRIIQAPSSETSFFLPEDSSSLEVLESFCSEANNLLGQARKTLQGSCSDSVHALLRQIHTVKGSAGFLELNQVQELAHVTEDMLSSVRDAGLELRDDQRNAVLRTIELILAWVDCLDHSIGDQSPIPFDREMEDHRRALEHAMGTGAEIVIRLAEGSSGMGCSQERGGIKVSSQSMIELQEIDLSLGDLVNRTMPKARGSELVEEFFEVQCLSRDLSRTVRAMNTVSLRGLLSKIARLSRETADRLSKVVRVDTSGEYLEVPRHLVSALSGPLVHLARNAVDHGLESSEERQASTKDYVARVEFRAYWKQSYLVVEVCDDGRGINVDAVIAKAKALSLIESDKEVSEQAAFALMMEPGFSTAEVTTDLSGRGVGLDAVKREIESAGGRIDISSERGKGSMFRVILPTDPNRPVPADLFEAQEPEESSGPRIELPEDIELAGTGEITFL